MSGSVAGSVGGLYEQLLIILSDQRRELTELRSKRREYFERIGEMDAKEIEVLIGMEKTEEIIENLRREGA